MKAEDVKFTELLEGPKQFIVPVFQRDYSWKRKHCEQLWKDVLRVGGSSHVKAHFVGSIVYIAAEDNKASITRWLLIDGQQRLTTVSLLLLALRDRMPATDPAEQQDDDGLPSRAEVDDYYLMNVHGKGDRKHKLHLRGWDHATLVAKLEGADLPKEPSEKILANYQFFYDQLENVDLNVVYRGIKKLVAVDVSLSRGQDNPQMIFESLNSTGLDLSQADLVRNYVLMSREEEEQTKLYTTYWKPIEEYFGKAYETKFDDFLKYYLTLKFEQSRPLREGDIYNHFKEFYQRESASRSVDDILDELKRFSRYFASFHLGKESNAVLVEPFKRLRYLVEVATPLVLRLYDYFDRTKTLTAEQFKEAIDHIESYVFRRSVCDMQTRNLGQIFPSIAYRIKEADPLTSLKVTFAVQPKKRRFPSDIEFKEALATRDVYDMKTCHYLLSRLENHDSKETIDTSKLSIEHVMPQNEEMRPEWKSMLGDDWKTIHETWLHKLGNLTLTGYNPELSDLPFQTKKTMEAGFNASQVWLNSSVREQPIWTPVEMESRGTMLAGVALAVWPKLDVAKSTVDQYRLAALKEQSAKHDPGKWELKDHVRDLLEDLVAKLKTIGTDVSEVFHQDSITYHRMEYFVEVIPRANRLELLFNMDYTDCQDDTGRAMDATERSALWHATESGGVSLYVDTLEQIADAISIAKQAYDAIGD